MSGCPGDDTLIALVEHALPAVRVEGIADHVDSCERCRATIGHLAAVDPSAQRPAMVGRYRLEDQLGVGGMGVVWAAWDPMLERRVAIKLMRPEVGEHGPARLMREARALAQLQHPNVVAVFDVGEHAGEVFIATELVDGEPLDRWQVERTRDAIVNAYIQAARGLAAAHAMGLVHRDVKPANVFVARDGRVRVGDFGLAKPPLAAESDPADRLTRDGAVVGTPAYMAPEQRAGKPVDGRADQFALCVALVEALTGKRPVAGDRKFELPTRLARALATGLAEDPDARFGDMTTLAEALGAPSPSVARSGIVVGVVAAAAVAGTALVMSFGLGGSSPPASSAVVADPLAAETKLGHNIPTLTPSTPSTPSAPSTPAPTLIARTRITPSAPTPNARTRITPSAPTPSAPAPTQLAPTPNDPSLPPSRRPSGSGSSSSVVVGMPDPNYVEAFAHVNANRASCVASFATFDASQATRPSVISQHDDTLFRARCALLAGNCAAGERALRALFTADGLSKPTVDADTQREVAARCPTSVGTWQQRLSHFQGQAVLLQSAPSAKLTRALVDAEAIARDGGAAMTRADRIDLSNGLHFVAEGFARLANHCAEARRARALADYAPMIMTPALTTCLTTSTP